MRIENMETNQQEIIGTLKLIKDKNEQMFNHFTERYEAMFKEAIAKAPGWYAVVAGLGGALIGGLAIFALTH